MGCVKGTPKPVGGGGGSSGLPSRRLTSFFHECVPNRTVNISESVIPSLTRTSSPTAASTCRLTTFLLLMISDGWMMMYSPYRIGATEDFPSSASNVLLISRSASIVHEKLLNGLLPVSMARTIVRCVLLCDSFTPVKPTHTVWTLRGVYATANMGDIELSLCTPTLDGDEDAKALDVPKERPRLLLSCAAADRYGMAFLCGALVALRDLRLLEHCRVMLSSGQACMLQALLMKVCTTQHGGWYGTVRPPSVATSGDPMHGLVRMVMTWCTTNHEWAMFKARLRRCRWSTWFDPWLEELAEILGDMDECWAQFHSVGDTSTTATTVNIEPDPVFFFGAQPYSADEPGGNKSFYLSTDNHAVNIPRLPVQVAPHNSVTHFSRYLASCVAPTHRLHPLSVNMRRVNSCHSSVVPEGSDVPRVYVVRNGLMVDALNVEAASLAFMQYRLNVMPSGHGLSGFRDLGGAQESDAAEKLLLLDAFSFSPAYYSSTFDVASRNATMVADTSITGATDERVERLLAYRKGVVQLYTSEQERQLDPTGGYTAFSSDLFEFVTQSKQYERMTNASEKWLRLCLNAGYYKAYRAYAGYGVYPSPNPLATVDDPYKLHRTLFPSAQPHGALAASLAAMHAREPLAPGQRRSKRKHKRGRGRNAVYQQLLSALSSDTS